MELKQLLMEVLKLDGVASVTNGGALGLAAISVFILFYFYFYFL
jgi:hypothetical protein